MVAGKIFISYRRDDDPAAAARLRDGLAQTFGKSNLFIDVDDLLAGQRFDEVLAKALASCDVLIAVIGEHWMELLKAKLATGERDHIREEIAAALQRRIVVIPARVGREGHLPPLPRSGDLPADIRDLVLYQKHDVTHERFGRDIAELTDAIRVVLGLNRAKSAVRQVHWGRIGAIAAGVLTIAFVGVFGIATWWGSPAAIPNHTPSQIAAAEPSRAEPVAKAEKDRKQAEAELKRRAEAALDPVLSCRLDGYSRPLRQTILVIDQAVIQPSAGINQQWINAIVDFAGVQQNQPKVISAPRERITVLLAPQDGSDLILIFTGCPASFTPAEFLGMEKQSLGIWDRLQEFVGNNARSRSVADNEAFRVSLLGALVQLQRMYPRTKSSPDDRSFLDAFPAISRAFNVANGIPRLILISPLEIPVIAEQKSLGQARDSGFNLAAKTDADLQRSEVYISSLSKQAGKYVGAFMQSFLLGIKGRLVSATSEAIPPVAEAPQVVQVFGGQIDYGGVKAPIQLRLAIDRTGSLVNSWVEVSLHKPVATPLTGKAFCNTELMEACEVKGDGKEFSQSWVLEPGPVPKFDSTLPFSGLRYFEFSSTATGLNGRFYDPVVIIAGKEELSFELARTGIKF